MAVRDRLGQRGQWAGQAPPHRDEGRVLLTAWNQFELARKIQQEERTGSN